MKSWAVERLCAVKKLCAGERDCVLVERLPTVERYEM